MISGQQVSQCALVVRHNQRHDQSHKHDVAKRIRLLQTGLSPSAYKPWKFDRSCSESSTVIFKVITKEVMTSFHEVCAKNTINYRRAIHTAQHDYETDTTH
jgi:hypothetical protein